MEVMDKSSKQWFAVSSLPKPLNNLEILSCTETEHIYLVGEAETGKNKTAAVYSYSVEQLLHTKRAVGSILPEAIDKIWNELPSTPTQHSSHVIINRQVVTLGGLTDTNEASNEVYYLDMSRQRWDKIAHMPTARLKSLVGYHPLSKTLIILGGLTKIRPTDQIDIAHIETSAH